MLTIIDEKVLESFKLDEVFVFYDLPRVFTLKTPADAVCLAVWASSSLEKESWFYVPISKEKLNSLKSGSVTLYSAIKNPEYITYLVTYSGDPQPKLEAFTGPELVSLPDEMFPAANFNISDAHIV